MTADQHHRYPCDHAVPIDQEPRHHLVIENELVRAFAVEIAPHDRTLCHHHAHDYLLYVVGDGDIISTARDEEPKKLSYRDGECELSDAGLTHVVENVGEEPFRNIVVELLAKGNELRRGVDPQKVLGDADIKRMLDDPRGAIFSIEIEPGSEVTIPEPAVVASPYGTALPPDALGDVRVTHNPTCDLAWIAPEQDATLFGCWEEATLVITFQVGSTDEEGSLVAEVREPLKSLHAHADK